MMANRIIVTGKTQTRRLLEMDVNAHNSPLTCIVNRMSNMDLLRCCHPLYRLDYASKLKEEGSITEDEYKSIRKINVDQYYAN